MDSAKIKEHLHILMELEKDSYTQRRLIASLEQQLSGLPDARNYQKPVYNELKASSHNEASGFGQLCVLGSIVLFILHFIYIALHDSNSLLLGILSLFFIIFEAFFPFLPFILLAVGLVAFIFQKLQNDDARYDAAVESKKRYESELKAYNLAVSQDKLRVERERPKKLLLQSELKSLKAMHAKTVNTLNKLYGTGVIHKKYWGLIPICSLYGYFDTGVCTQLEGHEGAYNKYDTESRLDLIVCKLDVVIQNLEEIKANQWMLYDAIQDSTQTCNKVLRSCNQMANQLNGIQSQGAELNARIANLQSTSDLNLYVNACAKRELEYMNRADRIF